MKYSQPVLDYFHQHDYELTGQPESCFNACACLGQAAHGDQVQVFLLIQDNRIDKLYYKIRAQVVTMAAMAYVAQHLQQLTIDQALALPVADIMHALDIGPSQQHCVLLVINAVKKAITQYKDSHDETVQS